MYEATLGTRMLGEIQGPRTASTEENLRGRDRSRLSDGTTAGAPGGALDCFTTSLGNHRGTDGPSGGGALAKGSASEDPGFHSTSFFFGQRPDPNLLRPDLSSFRQASRYDAPTKLSPFSARHDGSHLGRAPPDFPSLSASLPHVPSSGYSQPAGWADLVRADPLKVQDSHSLEMLRRIKERSRIEGAAPARKVEGQDTTPGPVSVEQNFAGEEPESVKEDLAGGESGPSAENLRDGLAEEDTCGLEHQVKIDQFQAFISRLSLAERLRVLVLPELYAVSSPVKTPSIRRAVELSKEDPVSDAVFRGNFRSAEGENSFHAAPRNFSNLGRVEFHAPPVITQRNKLHGKCRNARSPQPLLRT